jgi:hypothetical protein
MAEMSEAQLGAYHAAMDLEHIAKSKAVAARNAIRRADSQEGREYLAATAEWWEQRAKVAEEIVQKQERKA